MAFVPAPNIVSVEILGLKDGQVIENRVMVNVHTVPTPAILSNVESIVQTWIANFYNPLLPNTVQITGMKLTDQSAIDGIFLQTALTFVGGVASAALPNEVSYCLSLRSSSRGRSARGRLYVLGVAENQRLGQNRVTTAYRDALAVAGDSLVGSLAGSGYHWSIVSYQSLGVPRPGGPVYYLVTNTTTTDDVLDSQRRRRPGVGQ